MTFEKRFAVLAMALCMPNSIATAALFLLTKSEAAANVFGEGVVWLFIAAAYGPLLIIGAAALVVRLGRRPGLSSSLLVTVWACVALALVAAWYFHSVLESQLEMP